MAAVDQHLNVRAILAELGLGGFVADQAVGDDVSKSMADEHGWVYKHGQWVDTGEASSEIQQVLDVLLLLAGETDPNQIVQAALFSTGVSDAEPIHTGTVSDWLLRNRPHPSKMGSTNFGPVLQYFIRAAAEELGVPEIASLADFTGDEAPPAPIPGPRPYIIHLLGDGDPMDYYVAESLLRASSFGPIIVNLVYVSNQRAGKEVLESYLKIEGSHCNNVCFTDLGDIGHGLSNEEILRRIIAAVAAAYKSLRDSDVLTA